MASDRFHAEHDHGMPAPVGDDDPTMHSRRTIVRNGVKLAFVAPVLSTFFASEAYAANYSCYPLAHVCDQVSETKRQQCCGTMTCQDGGGFPVGAPPATGTCKP